VNGLVHDRLQGFAFRGNADDAARGCLDQWDERTTLQGEVVRLNHVAGAYNDRALDHVLELSNVARPAVPLQRAHGILIEPERLPALSFLLAFDDVIGCDRNVAFPLSPPRYVKVWRVPVWELSADRPSVSFLYAPFPHKKEGDLAKAKALLAQGGHPDGFTYTFEIINTPFGVQEAEVVKAQLAEAGITANVVPVDGARQLADGNSKTLESTTYNWSGRPDPEGNT